MKKTYFTKRLYKNNLDEMLVNEVTNVNEVFKS